MHLTSPQTFKLLTFSFSFSALLLLPSTRSLSLSPSLSSRNSTAASMSSSSPSSSSFQPTRTYVVIGAGLSGLVATNTILDTLLTPKLRLNNQQQNKPKTKIYIIEPHPRVGGRLQNNPSTSNVDVGGAWSWPSDVNLRGLAKGLDVDFIPQLWEGGIIDVSSGNFGGGNSNVVRKAGYGECACGPDAVRFRGGAHEITKRLHARILKHDSDVEVEFLFNRAVVGIDINEGDGEEGEVTITHEASNISSSTKTETKKIKSTKVIVATPPNTLTTTIKITPPLPQHLQKHMQSCNTWMHDITKIVATYTTQWWKEKGLSGGCNIGYGVNSVFQTTWDNSDVENGVFAIAGFCSGSGEGVSEERAVDDLVSIFGKDAASPVSVDVFNWNDGVYVHNTSKSATRNGRGHHDYGTFPVQYKNKLFFAATEFVNEHGHMEGAVIQGGRAGRMLVDSEVQGEGEGKEEWEEL